MKLDNFRLEEYDIYSMEHNRVLKEISDAASLKYLGDLDFHVKRVYERGNKNGGLNEVFIAYYNELPVGFISITHKDFGYEIASGIIPKERGAHLGELLLQEFSEKIFEMRKDVDELFLRIDSTNERGRNAALRVGYKEEGDKFIQKRR